MDLASADEDMRGLEFFRTFRKVQRNLLVKFAVQAVVKEQEAIRKDKAAIMAALMSGMPPTTVMNDTERTVAGTTAATTNDGASSHHPEPHCPGSRIAGVYSNQTKYTRAAALRRGLDYARSWSDVT